MDISRTASVIDRFLVDINENEIIQKLAQVASAVRDWASQTNETTAAAYSEAIEAFEEAVTGTKSQDLQPLSFKILKDLGGEEFVGNAPYYTVRNIVASSSGPVVAKDLVNEYRTKLEKFVSDLQILDSTFTQVGIELHELDETAEVGVIIPSSIVSDDVKSSQKIIADWARALENITDAVGDPRDSVKLVEVERGSLIVIFGATCAGAKMAFWIANQCLDFYSKILDIRLKSKELKDLGVSESSAQNILDEVEQMIESKISGMVSSAMSELEEHVARSPNEREKLIGDAAKYILDQIDKGTQIEVDFPVLTPLNEDEDDQAQLDPVAIVNEKELRHFGNTWRVIAGDERNVLRLEPSKEIEDDCEPSTGDVGE